MYETKFTVRGSFEFPLDMLRYDCAFPATQEAARLISEDADGLRDIELIQYGRDRWVSATPERWQSFGWEVIEQSEPTKR